MLLKINFDMLKLFYKISPENILEALKEEIILQFSIFRHENNPSACHRLLLNWKKVAWKRRLQLRVIANSKIMRIAFSFIHVAIPQCT